MNDISFFKELWERLKYPWKITSFVLYFIFVIIIFGGVGIWLPFFQKSSILLYHVADNMMTYSIALSIPACITIILQYFPKAENQVSLIISIISLLLIEVVVIVLFVVINSDWKFHIAVLGIVLSWIFWTIANSDNKYLDDKSYRQTIKDDLEKHGKDWN